jgi:hypothetical protein
MRALIRGLDALQRRILGVVEFSDDPGCLLRIQLKRTSRPLIFPDQAIPTGELALYLHLWNEHLPTLPPEGPDLAWAVRLRRSLVASLCAVARHLQNEVQLEDVRAVGGATALFSPGERSGGERAIRRLGFAVIPAHRPLGRFGEFWENLYATWLMWTFNPGSLRYRKMLSRRRAEIWMPVDEFLRRYGNVS